MVSIRVDPIKRQTSVSKFVSECLGGLPDVAVRREGSLVSQSEHRQISILNTLRAWLTALSKHIRIGCCFKPSNGFEVRSLRRYRADSLTEYHRLTATDAKNRIRVSQNNHALLTPEKLSGADKRACGEGT